MMEEYPPPRELAKCNQIYLVNSSIPSPWASIYQYSEVQCTWLGDNGSKNRLVTTEDHDRYCISEWLLQLSVKSTRECSSTVSFACCTVWLECTLVLLSTRACALLAKHAVHHMFAVSSKSCLCGDFLDQPTPGSNSDSGKISSLDKMQSAGSRFFSWHLHVLREVRLHLLR